MVQSFFIPWAKSIEHTSRSWYVFPLNCSYCPILNTDVLFELIIKWVYLSLHTIWIEQRIFEKLRKDVESIVKLVIINLELVVSIVFAGGCIGLAAMLRQELLVVIFDRILARSKQQHVLTKVRKSIYPPVRTVHFRDTSWIAQIASRNKHACCTFLNIFVLDKNASHSISKLYYFIISIIYITLDHFIRSINYSIHFAYWWPICTASGCINVKLSLWWHELKWII